VKNKAISIFKGLRKKAPKKKSTSTTTTATTTTTTTNNNENGNQTENNTNNLLDDEVRVMMLSLENAASGIFCYSLLSFKLNLLWQELT
jgi:hypothetical protein